MKKRSLSSTLVILVVIVYLLIPLFATAIYSLFSKWTDLLPENFTVAHYVELLTEEDFMMSLVRTIVICIIPILLTVLLVLLALFAVLLSVNTALIISFRKKGYKSAVIRILTVLTFAVVFAGLFVTSVWRDIKRTAIPAEGMGRLVVYEYRTGLYDAATLFYVNENGGVSMVDTNLRVLLDPDSAVPDAYCYSKGYGSVSAEDGTIYLYGVSGDGTRVREFTVNTEKYRGVFTWFEFFLLAVSASVIIPGTVFLVSACRRRKALSPPKPVKHGAEPSPAE